MFFSLSLDPWFTACVVPLGGGGDAGRAAARLESGIEGWEVGNAEGTGVDGGGGGGGGDDGGSEGHSGG